MYMTFIASKNWQRCIHGDVTYNPIEHEIQKGKRKRSIRYCENDSR